MTKVYAVLSAASSTPPVTPNISAAPVEYPSGLSKFSSSKFSKSIPADFIILASSLTVRDKSVSNMLFWDNSFLFTSYFLATQGIIDTTLTSSGFLSKTLSAK